MSTINKNFGYDVSDVIKKDHVLRNKIADLADEGQFDEIAAYGAIRQRLFNKNLEDYVSRHEAQLIEDLRKKLEKEREERKTRHLEEEKLRLKELHYMKCPQCGMDLHEVNFISTMVWACEECLGIWLKQGKLKNIMTDKASFYV